MREINRRTFLATAGFAAVAGITTKHSLITPQQKAPMPDFMTINNSSEDFYGALLEPYVKEVEKKRLNKMDSDSGYNSRIDWELNKRRINFLLFGYGETHEPPLTERAEIGSISVFSLDIPSRTIDIISFTHDIRAPEIERFQKQNGNDNPYPTKIYRAYEFGGFPLLGNILEDATGLSIDFQAAFHDRLIKKAVDDVLGGVEVDVDSEFSVLPFYLDGKKYPRRTFSKGRQELDGLGTLSFIKTVPDTNGKPTYPKSQEHNFRKHLVVKGIIKKFKANINNPEFLLKMFKFLEFDPKEDTLNYDFNPKDLFLGNIVSVAQGAGKKVFDKDAGKPFSIGETIYVVDYTQGDGGVQWVNASKNPVVIDEVKKGKFPDRSMEIPIDANPAAENLAVGYWSSVRNLVKKRLQKS